MRTFETAAVATIFACLSAAAHSECDLTKFGVHPPPPDPLRAPPVSDQYAKFVWGTDAYIAGSYWWVWNFVQNDPAAPSLVLTWQKAGIYIPTPNPLPHGQVICRQTLLGDTTEPTPILDQKAPIIYSVANQTQDAAVFIAAQGTSAPSTASSPTSDHARLNLPSGERFSTTFQQGNKLIPLTVNVDSDGGLLDPATGDRRFSLSFYIEPEGLTLAISDLPSIWTGGQMETVLSELHKQGFAAEELPPYKLMGSDFAKNLGLPGDVADRSFLVLRNGREAAVTYRGGSDGAPTRHDVYLVIFASGGNPVASEQIRITVPSSR